MLINETVLRSIVAEEINCLYNKAFKDREYIQTILGISIPLNESGHFKLTPKLKRQIIKEQLKLDAILEAEKKQVSSDITSPTKFISRISGVSTALDAGQFMVSMVSASQVKKMHDSLKKEITDVLDVFEASAEKIAKHAATAHIIHQSIKTVNDKIKGLQPSRGGNIMMLGVLSYVRPFYLKLYPTLLAMKTANAADDKTVGFFINAAKKVSDNVLKFLGINPQSLNSVEGVKAFITSAINKIAPEAKEMYSKAEKYILSIVNKFTKQQPNQPEPRSDEDPRTGIKENKQFRPKYSLRYGT